MDRGIPRNLITSLNYKSAILVALLVLLQGVKWDIFENRTTTTNMESLPYLVVGKPRITSMPTSTRGWVGTGNGMYNPCGSR